MEKAKTAKSTSAKPAKSAKAPRAGKSSKPEYYCVCVRRNYEPTWRFVTKHTTREEAQEELEKRKGFTGPFNYDNAELRVLSRSEAKKEFGAEWEFTPIGGNKTRRIVRDTRDDDE